MRTAWILVLALPLNLAACGSSSGSKEVVDGDALETSGEAFVLPDVAASPDAEVAILPGDAQGDAAGEAEATGPLYATCSKLLFQCVLACDEDDATCEDDCKAQAAQDAIDGWYAVQACGEANCPADMDATGWVTCFGATCVTDFAACTGGTGKCKDVRGCAAGCTPTDVGCVITCMGDGSAEAMTTFSQLYACIAPLCGDKTEPMAYQACVESAYNHECANLLVACEPH